ncbi:hypothetical protein GCM10009092_44250 [Bowmanella denitrificans]|uniref:Solute-binding protein family 3/N-terminal domain-containing protein n=1 Tax=Bowmanella denitrificans TaxID=366582 RepID=A0ABN0XXG1_9ALTE
MPKFTSLCLLFCLCCGPAAALAEPTKLLFSYIEHPQVGIVTDLLKSSYQSLGIELEFVKVAAERERIMAVNGELDGIAVRLSSMAPMLDNMRMVKVPLLKVQVRLVCRLGIECDNGLLDHTGIQIAVPQGSRMAADIVKKNQLKALWFTSNQQILDMLEMGRIDYGLTAYIDNRDFPFDASRLQLAEVSIHNEAAYHFLHKRHARLMHQVELALRRELAKPSSTN